MTTTVTTRPIRPKPLRAAWRQHGVWVCVVLGLVALGAVALVVVTALVPECASTDPATWGGGSCEMDAADNLWDLWRMGMLVLPPLAGVLLGASAFGPDSENRTAVHGLTQSVSRLRWWTAKVVVAAAPVFVAVLVLGMSALRVVADADDIVLWTITVTSPGFDTLGIIPASRFLLGFAAAALFAFRRSLAGIVLGLLTVFIMVQVGTMLRPAVVPHQRDLIPFEQWWADSTASMPDEVTSYGWGGYADAEGREIDLRDLDCGDRDYLDCMGEKGVVFRVETYVVESEHPQMMLVIGGLDLAVAGGFLALGARAVNRRDL